MKIVVLGSNGQLGQELQSLPKNERQTWIFVNRNQCDLTDYNQIKSVIQSENPDYLINCAAYTSVDKAESETDNSFRINGDALKKIGEQCIQIGCRVVHFSTDYVFDGQTNHPYNENSKTNPLGVYGKSKLAGEELLHASGCEYRVIRTSWVYSQNGKNFVNTIRRLAKERKELNVVNDQIGSPTFTEDLAKLTIRIIQNWDEDVNRNSYNRGELYHYSNEGIASWYDFAKAVVELNELNCNIEAIPSEQYPTPAPRPFYSVLSKEKIKRELNITIPHWRESLAKCLKVTAKFDRI